MIVARMATCTMVLPEKHGVLVSFGNGVGSIGGDDGPFVRVLARRAHPTRGAEVDLPEVGELGLVIELSDLHQFWIGGIHWQENNQVDGAEELAMRRHGSGVLHQTRQNGDMQFDHPSGLRVTLAGAQGALEALKRHGPEGVVPPETKCDLELEHPSGLKIHVDPDGALTMDFPAGGSFAVDKDGALVAQGFASMALQDANARFCMEALVDWVKTHKHISTGATSITTVPTTLPGEDALSPSTFKGPHA